MVKNKYIKLLRYTPLKNSNPIYVKYSIPFEKGMTVLDALIYIKENVDHSTTFRHSCRMGNCGACGMVINGTPKLACQTLISETDEIEVKPLENLPVIRDIVCDFTEFDNKHRKIKPYIICKDPFTQKLASEHIQHQDKLYDYLQFALCIKCGLCFHACPITSSNTNYLGPQALSQAYRYLADDRDEDRFERIEIIDSGNGCWGCHFAESCSEVCPKGVDPSLGIQLLKRMVMKSRLRGIRIKSVPRL